MKNKKGWPVVVMNFTGAYANESFAKDPRIVFLDCSHLYGTDCYCDSDAAMRLSSIISEYPAEGIHFIDSGNHHYLTKFWTDRMTSPFSLALFDHHTDMQPPMFEGMLSCGGWVLDMLEHNRFLDKVLVIGVSDSLAEKIGTRYGDRVHFFCESCLDDAEAWKAFSAKHISEPVYISVDKDVLDRSSARTDWDQGSMTLPQLKKAISVIFRNEEVAGVDICGELPDAEEIVSGLSTAASINDRTNMDLILFLESKIMSSVE